MIGCCHYDLLLAIIKYLLCYCIEQEISIYPKIESNMRRHYLSIRSISGSGSDVAIGHYSIDVNQCNTGAN